MSKRLAYAVATAAELNAGGDDIFRPHVHFAADPVKKPSEEAKDDDLSPAPPLSDSDSDSDDAPSSVPSSQAAIPHDQRYLTHHDLLNLPPLPPRPSSRPSEPEPAPSTSFRHRTNIYIDRHGSGPTEVFTTAFSPDSRFIAAGCGDGTVRVYSVEGKLRSLFHAVGTDALPVTCMRFRPASASAFSSLQNVLMATSADGTVSHYHLSSATAKPMTTLPAEPSNQLFACAYEPSALSFATAGRDATIRIYDEETRALTHSFLPLSRSSAAQSGHSNRIYALHYHPSSPILFSAGWDNSVLAWDLRTDRPIASLYGPHICGDALDVHPDGRRLLTGSWRESGALEEWDWAQGTRERTLEYNKVSTAGGHGKAEMLYTAHYSHNGHWLAAGGCATNDAKLTRTDAQRWEEKITLKGAVYTLAFSADGRKLAVAGADANLLVVDL